MIAECQRAIADWETEEEGHDPDAEFVKDWTLRLSQGEYEDRLYWECVAEEHEENGDWQSAIDAYREIIKLPTASLFEQCKVHSSIGQIQRLLGDNTAALDSYSLVSAKAQQECTAVRQHFAAGEIWQRLHMGEIGAARKLIRQALPEYGGESGDYLGVARLLTMGASCEIIDENPDDAGYALQQALQWLEAAQDLFRDEESMRDAKGIHLGYANWWSVEANRCQINGDIHSEIFALEQAREKTELCFDPDGWQVPWDDLRLMNILLRLSNAYVRDGKPGEAASARKEADTIFARRKFPDSARIQVGDS